MRVSVVTSRLLFGFALLTALLAFALPSAFAEDQPPSPLAPSEGIPLIREKAPPPLPSNAAGGALITDAEREPGSDMTAYVVVFSPGAHPFFKFGHNAIWVRDPQAKDPRRRDVVYNWGTFSFGDPALIPKFVVGRFMYWLSTQSIESTKRGYAREGRAVDVMELDLTPAQKIELQRRLEVNLLPENRYYRYDYYEDNCSTRVRDMIDGVVGGRVKAISGGPGRFTYREHTMRMTESLPAEAVALNLAMGDFIDKPTTVWQEAFLPSELTTTLRKVTVIRPDGTEVPLVKGEQNLVPTKDAPPPAEPPTWWFYFLGAGILMGGVFAALGRGAAKNRWMRVVLGLNLSFFGFLIGFLGCFFLAVWGFTDHRVGYGNENIWVCAPWAIILTGTGLRTAWGRVKSIRFAERLVFYAAVSAIIGVLLKVLPWFDQKNGWFLLFFVPFWVGLAYGLRELVASLPEATKPSSASVAKASTTKSTKKDVPEGDAGAAKRKPSAKSDAPTAKPKSEPPTPPTEDEDEPKSEPATKDEDEPIQEKFEPSKANEDDTEGDDAPKEKA